MTEKRFSREFLNAFVDDQLSPEDKSQAYPVLNQDEELNRYVCELRKVRDLVRLGYRNPPQPAIARPMPRRGTWMRSAVAASALLALGLVIGWGLHGVDIEFSPSSPQTAAPEPSRATPAYMLVQQTPVHDIDAMARAGEMKVLFHLNNKDPARMREVLDEAENMLKEAAAEDRQIRVTVITNGEGLALLRADKTPFADRIRDMYNTYPGLVFAACQNTIDRLKREQGIQAQLLPEAIVTDSGVAQIILLQQRGWAYIRV